MLVNKDVLGAMRGLNAAAAVLGKDAVAEPKKALWQRIHSDHNLPQDRKLKVVTSDTYYAGEIRDAGTGQAI